MSLSPNSETGEVTRSMADRGFLLRIGFVFALFALLFLVVAFQAIMELRFPDPDDTLRMIQVRDLLAGQGWFDLHQYRVDAPRGGVLMHWSRLVDIPLAFSIMILRPLLGQNAAELATMILVPVLTFLAALLLIGRIAWRKLGADATTFACFAVALCVPVISQLRPLRIDHHGWQIVLALLAANGLMARSPRLGGWTIGLALAAWMSISIEGLPLAALFVGLLALRWLRDPSAGAWMFHAMLALGGGSLLLFFVTHGLADLAQHCDSVSPVHLAIFVWGTFGTAALAVLRPRSPVIIMLGLGVIGLGAVAILLSLAPQCAGGAFAGLDPLVQRYWYANVLEGRPVWLQSPGSAAAILVPPLAGIYAALRLARREADWTRSFWFEYAILLAGAAAVSVLVSRAGSTAGALAAPPLGWLLANWYGQIRENSRPGARVAGMVALALVVVPGMPFTLYNMVAKSRGGSGSFSVQVSDCNIRKATPVLAKLGKAEMLAPLDISPDILYFSNLSVFGTGHHRGNLGMRDAIALFVGSPEQAKRDLAARHTRYIALCGSLAETEQYRHFAPHSLTARLLEGPAPAWLRPVPVPTGTDLHIWEVVR